MSIRDYDANNIFAQVLIGKLPCKRVYEDQDVLSFYDKYPDAPIHILVIPKKQYISYDNFIINASSEEIVHFFRVIKDITHKYDLDKTGYRLVTNHGKDGEQVVYHFHMHILGGTRLGKLCG